MKFRLALLALSAVLLAGCAEKPYYYSDYRNHQLGVVIICSDDSNSTPEQIKAMAAEICTQYDRVPQIALQQKHQCSWTAPTQTTFNCISRPGERPVPFTPRTAPLRRDPNMQ